MVREAGFDTSTRGLLGEGDFASVDARPSSASLAILGGLPFAPVSASTTLA